MRTAKKYALVIREGEEQRTVFIGSLFEVMYKAKMYVLSGVACGIVPCS